MPSIFTQVRQVLNLDPSNEKLEKPLKEMITGLISTVNGLNNITNKVGDRHAGNRKLNLHHGLLAVNAAKSVTNFLFHTYVYQKEKGLLKKGEVQYDT
ncbi:abortive infection family protein [Bacillus inaquosorum]|uniref:abortive infection family protein n=1 Tax=Bacillus inaquosorum TaxID=483913 RepID=UPI003D1A40C8